MLVQQACEGTGEIIIHGCLLLQLQSPCSSMLEAKVMGIGKVW